MLRRLSRSLLQYARDAFPWTSYADQDRLQVLKKLIDEELRAGARLSAFLRRRRIPLPALGVFPQVYTNMHYLSLDHLLPFLIEQEKAELVELERDAAKLWDDLEAREQAQSILDMTRRHVQALEQLAAPAAATA
jgi:hypothetical protein